ncbi:MAG: efflux RND transporter periplasmic adaptor subunit [Kiritimatiellae bacterium]|nr:efflux RND transporter periplasmic adaptor subunit [Kiritimatiellia bacterium]
MNDAEKEVQKQTIGHRIAAFFGWLVTAACFLLIGWFVGQWWASRPKAGAEQRTLPTQTVAVMTVTNAPFNPPEEFIGHVEPVQEVDILPQIEGYITDVKFSEGADVKKGDLLFEIDSEQYSATEMLREAEIKKSESQVSVAEAEVDRTKRYLERLKSADARGITKTDMDTAETSYASAQANLASMKAGVSQAKANLALAKFNMKHTKIYAPISGQIGKSLVHAGDFVSPSKGAMARIVQTDPIRVTFPMTDRAYIDWREQAARQGINLQDNRNLHLILSNNVKYGKPGKWEFDDNEMSAETATLLMRISFPNPDKVLIPNAFVTVLTDAKKPDSYLLVPQASLVKSPKGYAVWVMKEDKTAELRPIEHAGMHAGLVAVTKGLKEGDRVVFQGIQKVIPGQVLNIEEPTTIQ